MAYWKRQYTERPSGKPLFRPEPKSAGLPARPGPEEPAADPGAEPKPPDEEMTGAKPPSE
jgi:hypothetical protein